MADGLALRRAEDAPPAFTRAEVARTLGVGITRIRALERAGRLHPTRDAKGIWRFDREEVLAYATKRKPRATTDGRIAARVFTYFREGWPLPDIVIETCQPPEEIRRLYEEYLPAIATAAASTRETRARSDV